MDPKEGLLEAVNSLELLDDEDEYEEFVLSYRRGNFTVSIRGRDKESITNSGRNLAGSRYELMENVVESKNLWSFTYHIKKLGEWLSWYQCYVGIEPENFWGKLQLPFVYLAMKFGKNE